MAFRAPLPGKDVFQQLWYTIIAMCSDLIMASRSVGAACGGGSAVLPPAGALAQALVGAAAAAGLRFCDWWDRQVVGSVWDCTPRAARSPRCCGRAGIPARHRRACPG